MNMIACATVIRGKGGCQAYMNGIVNEEMKRLNEKHAADMSRMSAELEAAKAHRNKLMKDALKRYEESTAKITAKKGFFARLKEGIVFAWCCLWVWVIDGKLIEEVRDE